MWGRSQALKDRTENLVPARLIRRNSRAPVCSRPLRRHAGGNCSGSNERVPLLSYVSTQTGKARRETPHFIYDIHSPQRVNKSCLYFSTIFILSVFQGTVKAFLVIFWVKILTFSGHFPHGKGRIGRRLYLFCIFGRGWQNNEKCGKLIGEA